MGEAHLLGLRLGLLRRLLRRLLIVEAGLDRSRQHLLLLRLRTTACLSDGRQEAAGRWEEGADPERWVGRSFCLLAQEGREQPQDSPHIAKTARQQSRTVMQQSKPAEHEFDAPGSEPLVQARAAAAHAHGPPAHHTHLQPVQMIPTSRVSLGWRTC